MNLNLEIQQQEDGDFNLVSRDIHYDDFPTFEDEEDQEIEIEQKRGLVREEIISLKGEIESINQEIKKLKEKEEKNLITIQKENSEKIKKIKNGILRLQKKQEHYNKLQEDTFEREFMMASLDIDQEVHKNEQLKKKLSSRTQKFGDFLGQKIESIKQRCKGHVEKEQSSVKYRYMYNKQQAKNDIKVYVEQLENSTFQ